MSLKLGLATALGIFVMLTAYGAVRLRRENAAFEHAVRRDHDTLSRAVARLASAAVERRGVQHALQLVEDADVGQAQIAISFRPDARARPGAGPHSEFVTHGGHRALLTQVPVELGTPGFIEFYEPLEDEDRYLAETRTRTALMTLALIAFSAGIIFTCGFWFVGRPLRLLALKAREVGEGKLDRPLTLRQHDEIGQLAHELNAMCDRLAAANARVSAESAARERALAELRHAGRLATVGQLAAGIAHELGTPLNVAGARAKMIARGESQGAEARADADVVVQQVERMTRIIRQLLDFARPRPPKRSRADLSALIDSTLTLLASTAAKNSVCLRNPSPSPCTVELDVMQMQQVLANLVMNAIHAQPRGGEVRVWAESDAAGASLFVEDDGEGMSEDVRERAFEPFFTTKDPGLGTGLGLSVVHGIVEEHGGRIVAGSGRERGTRMHVRLPRLE